MKRCAQRLLALLLFCLAMRTRLSPSASIYSGILGPLLRPSLPLAPPLRPPATPTGSSAPEHGAEPKTDPQVKRLLENVETSRHDEATGESSYDLLVLGAGVAGLISCIVGRQLGRRVALIEPHYMGGDCLNTGCVPSKALIAAAKNAAAVPPEDPDSNFQAAMSRMRRIRAEISKHDSVKRYREEVGVDIISGYARFSGPNEVSLQDGRSFQFRKCILGTGAAAKVPEFLQGIPHLTSSNLWNLQSLPPRMVVLGAGPIGLELAQSFQRLGCEVTVVIGPSGKILGKEDEEAAELVMNSLRWDGVLFICAKVLRVACKAKTEEELYDNHRLRYRLELGGAAGGAAGGPGMAVEAEALLNATGRRPRTEELDLEAAGIQCDGTQLHVNELLQTTNLDVFAAGDCLPGPERFTHAAEWQARVAVRNALLDERLDARRLLVPRATYTDPEVASVGWSASELQAAGKDFQTYVRKAAEVDRNRCDGVEEGYAALHVAPDGEILGATIVGPRAGDQISEVTLCMQHGLTAADLAGTMHPYPTSAEVVRQAAQAFVRSRIFRAENQEMLKTTSDLCETLRSELKESGLHIISLARPQSLNACDPVMAKSIAESASRPARAVLLQSTQAGAEGKVAFCAGGDVKSVAQAVKEDPTSSFPRLQLAHEYLGVAALSRKREDGLPVVCFMDGICMGFGLGLAMAAEFRIATERSLLAMPECVIGITPDVGFAATSAVITPGVGKCMSLTGWRLTGEEALACGLASHLIPSNQLVSLRAELEEIDWSSSQSRETLVDLLNRYQTEKPAQCSLKKPAIQKILQEVFTPVSTAKEAAERLQNYVVDDDDAETQQWIQERLEGFGQGCPLCQEVIVRLLDIAHWASSSKPLPRHRLLSAALERDFAALSRLAAAPDFYEGVRAALIDKDKQPKWVAATLDDVDPAEVYRLLAPLPQGEQISFE